MSEMSHDGDAPAIPHAAEIVEQLQALIVERRKALAGYDRARAECLNELKAYEKALAPLTGEAPKKPGRKPKSEPRPVASRPSGERIALYKEAILRWVETHGDEFRQVDIRGQISGPAGHSSVAANVFEALRQDPAFIRLARQQRGGVNDGRAGKYFRLTPAGQREAQS